MGVNSDIRKCCQDSRVDPDDPMTNVMNQMKFIARLILSFGFAVLLSACRPTAQEIAGIVRPIPLGVSRADVSRVLVNAYGKRFPDWNQSYALTDPPISVTQHLIWGQKEIVDIYRKHNWYTETHSADLFSKLQGAVFNRVGLTAEASEGNGSFTIFFDRNAKYIGFFAYSDKHYDYDGSE